MISRSAVGNSSYRLQAEDPPGAVRTLRDINLPFERAASDTLVYQFLCAGNSSVKMLLSLVTSKVCPNSSTRNVDILVRKMSHFFTGAESDNLTMAKNGESRRQIFRFDMIYIVSILLLKEKFGFLSYFFY